MEMIDDNTAQITGIFQEIAEYDGIATKHIINHPTEGNILIRSIVRLQYLSVLDVLVEVALLVTFMFV